MSIYDINFSSRFNRLLPIKKRKPKFLALGTSLTYPLQWARDLMFNGYANGDVISPDYNGGTSYSKGDRVRYLNAIYEVFNTPPSSGYVPTDTNYWIKIQDDWRGARERLKYNGQHLVLEYILNRWFGTAFRQPAVGNSDIYIDELITDDGSFLIGADESDTAMIAALESFQTDLIPASYTAQIYSFQVNYPLSLIPSTSYPKYNEMVALVEKYRMYSTLPTYVGY